MQFRILGPLEIEHAGQSVRIGGVRQQRALALLLVNANTVVPFNHLVDVLWEEPPRSTRQQIHNVIGGLRRTLRAASNGVAVVTTEIGYRISLPPDSLDAHRFQSCIRAAELAEAAGRPHQAVAQLGEAAALWRGPALAGLDGNHLTGVATRLNEQRLIAVERLMALRLDLGESDSLISELLELVAEQPLRESLRHSLVLALSRSGRQADALDVYGQGRRLLAEELGIDPGPRLRRLHELVLAGDVDVAQPESSSRARPEVADRFADEQRGAPRRHTAPRTVPYDTVDFTGRAAETAVLLTRARTPHPALTIVAIDGMGGVGKTALAVHVAHRLAEDYSEGQYYIDLHGFSANMDPLTAAQALDILLVEHGTPAEDIPSGVAGKSALWRSELAGRRALVVLDNVLDVAQVRPLLPGTAGVFVMLTCRRRLTALDGAVPVSLDVLPHEDAVALFTEVAGPDRVAAEPGVLDEAVRLCGHLPLALRVAAARLRDRSAWSVSDLVDRLRSHRRRTRFLQAGDRSVMAVLALSYRYLQPKHREVFRLLSLHPGEDFDAAVTATIAGISLDEAERCLEVLFEDNLLLRGTADRFRFHDLIHDCAYSLVEEHDDDAAVRAAQHRILDYYLHTAATWSADLALGAFRFTPEVTHVPEHVRTAGSDNERVALLGAEYRNLLTSARFAAANGWHAHAWQLACALQPFLKLQNYGGDSLELFENALRAARALGDRRGESASLTGLALVYRERGPSAKAAALLEEAVAISHQRGDRYTEAFQLGDLAVVHSNNDQIQDAYRILRRAHDAATESGDLRAQAAIVNNLGVVCLDLGEYAEASEHFRSAMSQHATGDSPLAGVLTLWNIGLLHHLQGRHHEAIAVFEEVLAVSGPHRYGMGETLAFVGLCIAHRATGRFATALEHGRAALNLARRFDLREMECDALDSIGEALLSLGELVGARATFTRAREFAEEHGYRRYTARAQEGLGHVATALGDLDGARAHWEAALLLYPAEMADAQNARTHLSALSAPSTPGRDGTVCARCEVSPAPFPDSRGE